MDFQEWCETRSIEELAKKLESSKPEEILGFYLSEFFGDALEYHKKFKWLGDKSLDFYVETSNLAIEYNGKKTHENRGEADEEKKRLCKENGIQLVRIIECENDIVGNAENTDDDIMYYYSHSYSNISKAIYGLCDYINQKCDLNIKFDVDIKRDKEEIKSYIMRKLNNNKYFEKTIAYKWPEVKDYWSSENKKSIFDVLCMETNKKYDLKCPRCEEPYKLMMKYDYKNRALRPCKCEYAELDEKANEFISNYDGGEILFYDTFNDRRLYDRVILNLKHNLTNKKYSEMYKKMIIK